MRKTQPIDADHRRKFSPFSSKLPNNFTPSRRTGLNMPQSLGRSTRVSSNVYRNQWIKKSPISHGVYYPGPLQVNKPNNKIFSNKKAILNKISKNLPFRTS